MESSEHDLLLPAIKEDNICLPLSINAVSKYWNVDLPMSEAAEIAKKYPNVNGSMLIEGIELAERHGLGSLILHSNLNELKKFIDMGIPPIVILPGVHNTIQHASVISGYDDVEKTILHYIPEFDNEGEFQVGVIPEIKFYDLWSEDSKLVIILAPLDIIPKIKIKNDAKVNIQNIVASIDLGGKIHLEKVARTLPRSMYEPEQFPGVIHRMLDPKTVILIFASGKLVCTGVKTEKDVYR